ncbi:elongation factor 4 [Candidatus Dojkabacteria bacterium]|nr:elongation factor 4 [Candidatus Dojkabacteria bacterium]
MDKIRNFSIIAHIDHGKSTLADRFLEITGLKDTREKNSRVLDTLELEQEKGITIKLQPASMQYQGYTLNLIDTPGHVDFAYEVSRSLTSCEGAILLVDASQGIQAQTLSTTEKAINLGLKIIPVLNKIDIPGVNVDKRINEMIQIMGFKKEDILLASGKTGQGAEQILNSIIDKVPAPTGDSDRDLQALIFDSFYDDHKGVVCAVRIFNGSIAKNVRNLYLLKHGNSFSPREIGIFQPHFVPKDRLSAGEVGYIATGLKDIRLFTVGDTISDKSKTEPLAGYKPPKAMVFASLFPTDPDDYPELSESLIKLSMNDAALSVTPQKSNLLGSGYRCGFLGMLHMEITQERLEREFDISLVITAPTVEYRIKKTNGQDLIIQSADDFPDPSAIQIIQEPWASVNILCPQKYMGPIMDLCNSYRGQYKDIQYMSSDGSFSIDYITIKYEIPLMSLITNFFDNMKALSSGYASLDYNLLDYRDANVVKVSILVNDEEIPSLSFLEIEENATSKTRKVLVKLKETIPRHQFKIALQGAIGSKIIAREDISAYRKDVTGKLYGGDITRKKKLLEKQKKGKKRMREIGKVSIPQKAFLAVVTA